MDRKLKNIEKRRQKLWSFNFENKTKNSLSSQQLKKSIAKKADCKFSGISVGIFRMLGPKIYSVIQNLLVPWDRGG